MELKAAEFTRDSNGDTVPSHVEVRMTIEEALWIAKVAGKQRGDSPHVSIFDCLVGDVFNRYWDNGPTGADQEHPVEIPPIHYPEG